MPIRPAIKNPAFSLSDSLADSPLTAKNYCTSREGRFDDTSRKEMQEAMDAYRSQCKEKSLALFFHGGLVDKASGIASARQLIGPYSAPRGSTGDAGNAYPYFFVWESGLLETLQRNLSSIIGEAIFQRIRDIVGAKAQSVLLGAAADDSHHAEVSFVRKRTPTADVEIPSAYIPRDLTQFDIEQVQESVESDPLINIAKQKIVSSAEPLNEALSSSNARTGSPRMSSVTLLSPDIVAAILAENAQRHHETKHAGPTDEWTPLSMGALALGAGKVLMRIVARYAKGRNHNFHNTVEEEIFRQFYLANVGGAIWNAMKRDTAEAFGSDDSACVGAAMIVELVKMYESNKDGQQARVTLIGHSAGAIYICNFLAAMADVLHGRPYSSEIKFDIILMAPAVRADVLANALAKHSTLIRHLRVFAMSDDIESTEKLVQAEGASKAANLLLGEIYTSSLLYFIAGVLEDNDDDTPIAGMRRFFSGEGAFARGKIPEVDAVERYFEESDHSVVVSDTAGIKPPPRLGHRCSSHHHGGFPSDPLTLQSVCYLLQTADYS